MTTLTGSEKQVAWAEQIRAKIIAEINTGIANLEANKEKLDEVGVATLAMLHRVVAQTKASWWIDHKGMTNLRTMCVEAGLGGKTKPEVAANLDQFCK